ncbi:o-methyltransferase [Colletotrichum chrysophilum]|uniref:O-methyltransferase n=1 Tax=Colletotrichum chrysophilum TaxID=1836956 RepID=A0AAD8ZXS5_9PEZI|nr:o-methyltransferase [Colletotrichum chrysophilum]
MAARGHGTGLQTVNTNTITPYLITSRSPRSHADAQRLLGMVDLLRESVLTVTKEWEKERNATVAENSPEQAVPNQDLFEAQRTIGGIAGTLIGLVAEPAHRVQQVMTLAIRARALILAAEIRIPDKLKAAARLMRTLCAIHIFDEPEENHFMNNRISQVLIDDEPSRSLVQLASMHSFTSDYLGRYLLGPTGASYEKDETAFQIALGIDKTQFDWFAEKVAIDEVQHGGQRLHKGNQSNFDPHTC